MKNKKAGIAVLVVLGLMVIGALALPSDCGLCQGSGKCRDCKGNGNCFVCMGTGIVGREECFSCEGSGACFHCHGNGECSICHGTGKGENW